MRAANKDTPIIIHMLDQGVIVKFTTIVSGKVSDVYEADACKMQAPAEAVEKLRFSSSLSIETTLSIEC